MNPEREQPPSSVHFEEVVRIAKEVLLRDGYHIPTLIVEGTNDSLILQFDHMAQTHEARAQQLLVAGYAVGHDMSLVALRQVFFITEAWLSIRNEDGLPEIPPSADPNRIEVLAITGLDLTKQHTSMLLLEMVRNDQDKLVELREQMQASPGHEAGYSAESPLLDAFVTGFRAG